MHLPQHGRKHRGGCGGIKHRLWSQPHGYSVPSILLASVQVLNKLDSHQDIRNCNVFCFTETWLSAGIPDSAREDVESLATDISLLGAVDWVMMRFCFGLPHHAGAGKAGEVRGPPAVLRCRAAHRDLQAGRGLCLSVEAHQHRHQRCLKWETTPYSIHKGIATAIVNSEDPKWGHCLRIALGLFLLHYSKLPLYLTLLFIIPILYSVLHLFLLHSWRSHISLWLYPVWLYVTNKLELNLLDHISFTFWTLHAAPKGEPRHSVK